MGRPRGSVVQPIHALLGRDHEARDLGCGDHPRRQSRTLARLVIGRGLGPATAARRCQGEACEHYLVPALLHPESIPWASLSAQALGDRLDARQRKTDRGLISTMAGRSATITATCPTTNSLPLEAFPGASPPSQATQASST